MIDQMSMTQIVASVSLPVLLLSVLIAVLRLLIGPRAADRILALDLMSLLVVGIAAAHALLTDDMVYLDVTVVAIMVTFLATIAFSRYIVRRFESGEAQR